MSTNNPTHTGPPRWQQGVLLGLLLCCALYTRTTNWSGTFVGDQVFFGGLDSYYHMRRVHLTVDAYPEVPTFDLYANFPEGNSLIWPIGFDWVVATIGKVAKLADDSTWVVEVWAALFSALMGVLTCALVFLTAKKIAGRAAGYLSLALAAVLPFFSNYSMIGRFDHHCIEPIALLAPLLCIFGVSGSRVAKRRGAILTGVCLGVSFAFWQGTIFIAFLVALSFVPGCLSRRNTAQPEPDDMAEQGMWIFGAATLAVLPVTLMHPWAYKGSFAYLAPSWFNPTCLFLAWSAFYGFYRARLLGKPPLEAYGAFVGTPLLFGVALALSFEELGRTLVLAWEYISRGDAQISQVEESLPLFEQGLHKARTQYTWLIYGAPLLFLAPLKTWQRESIHFRIAFLWFCVAGALATIQLRQGTVFAPLWCVGWGIAATRIHSELVSRFGGEKRIRALLSICACALLWPTLSLHRPLTVYGTQQFTRSLDAIVWLRDHAESPGDFMKPGVAPEFSVMSRWQWGHWLTQISHQANVANPLGQTPDALRGVRDSVLYYVETDPEIADKILHARGSRYVLVSPILSELKLMLKHTRTPLDTFLTHAPNSAPMVTPLWSQTMNTRLHHFDGRRFKLGENNYAPLRNMRLVYDGQTQTTELGKKLSYCKIFERVAGATLEGSAIPGATVDLSVDIRTNLGRQFQYRDSTVADAKGNFRFKAPYASGLQAGGLKVGNYAIASGDTSRQTISVPEPYVLEGKKLVLGSGAAR